MAPHQYRFSGWIGSQFYCADAQITFKKYFHGGGETAFGVLSIAHAIDLIMAQLKGRSRNLQTGVVNMVITKAFLRRQSAFVGYVLLYGMPVYILPKMDLCI